MEKNIIVHSIPKIKIQKVGLVSTTSTPVTTTKKEAPTDAETRKIDENSMNGKNGDEDLETNLI